jgi:hypothetical protein
MPFNKKLSQLESIYSIAPPVVDCDISIETVLNIINDIIENPNEYDLTNNIISWFSYQIYNDIEKSVTFLFNILQESDIFISENILKESLKKYRSNHE